LLNTLIRIDVLHIVELGYLNLKPEQTNIFLKLMEERYRRKPTIITTNLDYPEWQAFLGNKARRGPPQSPAPSVPHHPDRRSVLRDPQG
jgi:DNA replication protein DnaC